MAKMPNRGPTKRFLISEMDRSVKRMLKLINEDADSFAKKAELYIQKRPELISQVEDFYRMFRTLAERYDNATFELSRNIPSDIRSQGCGNMTEIVSEPQSRITSPEHRLNRLTRRLSGTQTAYFDYIGNKGYETSTYDSGSDSDDSFYNNYSSSSNYGNYRRLRKKITELEAELRKIQIEQEVNKSNSQIVGYEEELRIAKEKIRSNEEEIDKLRMKLEKYESNDFSDEDYTNGYQENRIYAIEEKLGGAEEDMKRLRDEFESNENDEIEDLKEKISELEEEMRLKDDQIEEMRLKDDQIEEMRLKDDQIEEMRLKDDQIEEMNDRLNKLQLECEKSSKSIEELRCRGREFEKIIEKQREVIEEVDEEKTQAVRQLSFSLEHYRNAYQMLRQDLLEHKKPVMAS